MRGVIKAVLEEELKNSLRMEKGYISALSKLPKGCLVVKNIRGKKYCYLAERSGKKIKYKYIGKSNPAQIKKYREVKLLRAKYRNLLSQVKKQVRFLRSSLRGKEPV